jgi:hypothetical protein
MSTTVIMTSREIAFRNALQWIDTARADLCRNDRVDAIDSLHMAIEALQALSLPQVLTYSGSVVTFSKDAAFYSHRTKA